MPCQTCIQINAPVLTNSIDGGVFDNRRFTVDSARYVEGRLIWKQSRPSVFHPLMVKEFGGNEVSV